MYMLPRLLSASGSWDDSIIFYRTWILVAVLALKSINYQADWLDILLNFFQVICDLNSYRKQNLILQMDQENEN